MMFKPKDPLPLVDETAESSRKCHRQSAHGTIHRHDRWIKPKDPLPLVDETAEVERGVGVVMERAKREELNADLLHLGRCSATPSVEMPDRNPHDFQQTPVALTLLPSL